MMAQKALLFDDEEIYDKISTAKSPAEAKTLGRKVRNFNEVVWQERVLVEASLMDKIWGIGLAADRDRADNPKRWNGLNLLGFALMQVRDMLEK